MFGGFGVGRIMHERERSKNLPERTVTREQFIQAMLDAGSTMKQATLEAKVQQAFGMGVYFVVGKEMLTIGNVPKKK